jgi:hypothetical protein
MRSPGPEELCERTDGGRNGRLNGQAHVETFLGTDAITPDEKGGHDVHSEDDKDEISDDSNDEEVIEPISQPWIPEVIMSLPPQESARGRCQDGLGETRGRGAAVSWPEDGPRMTGGIQLAGGWPKDEGRQWLAGGWPEDDRRQ